MCKKGYRVVLFLMVSIFLACAGKKSVYAEESNATGVPGAREVPHYTFSGTPAQPGTGVNGDVWDGNHYYLADGTLATECFFCDGVCTYYLQNDGTPMKNRLTYHPDGEHIIYFNNLGQEAFNTDVIVQYSITGEEINKNYYFNVYGFMYVDELTFMLGNAEAPEYFDYSGARIENTQCLLPNGDLVIADKNGILVHNKFTYDAFGRIVYCNWNGCVAKGTLSDQNFKYVFDEKDGHLIAYYPLNNSSEDLKPFQDTLFTVKYDDNVGACTYEMRLLGNNPITQSINNWYSSETVIDYMNENVDDQYWRLSIYKDADGNIINNITGEKGTYSTIRGVTIGTGRDAVREAYGQPLYMGNNGIEWDWYGVEWQREEKYAVDWQEGYACIHYGIRFYYDENGLVNQIVYQKYPMLPGGYTNNAPIMEDVQDITPYYARREIINVEVDEETEMPVVLDASKSKYASEGCSYQWYEIKVGAASVHNADEIEKIQNADGNKFEWNVGEFKNGVYCRIRTQDGIPYDVFYKKK